MKNKNYIIIGAVVLAAFFFFKKKKTVTKSNNPILTDNGGNGVLSFGDGHTVLPIDGGNLHPRDPLADNFNYSSGVSNNTYPGGITEGMHVVPDNDSTQYIIQNGKKFELTNQQWQERGYDAYTIIRNNILDQIDYGGLYNNGL